MTHEQIIKLLRDESNSDALALWWIIGYASNETGVHDDPEPLAPLPITNPVEVKAKTLALVRDLLNTKCLMAGEVSAKDIHRVDPWLVPVEVVIERIDREWSALGKEPDDEHDVVWLGACTPEEWPHGG